MGEDSKRLLRQADRFGAVLAQLAGAKVKFKRFETDKRLGGVN
jgi:hypothetical protein